MLPNLKTSAIAAVLAAAVAAAPVSPALAWGEGEQNFLSGVLAAVAVGALLNQANKSRSATPAPNYFVQPGTRRPADRQPAYRPPVAAVPSYRPYPSANDRAYIPSVPSYGTSASAAHSAFLNYSPAMRRAIQTRLSYYGYYTGAIDGVWGPRTDAAVQAYARDQGLIGRLGTYTGAVAVLDNLAA